MASFHFRLERVLRLRQTQLAIEEAKQKKLLQEQVKLQTFGAQVGVEKTRLSTSLGTLPDMRGEDLRAMTAYSLRLKKFAENLAAQVARCERDLAAQRKKCREAERRVRLLEELKTRKAADWRYEQDHELEVLASEAYLANWDRDRL